MCPSGVRRRVCEQESCSQPLMISYSHIPAIADHYSLVCSTTPERSAFGQPCAFRLHTNTPPSPTSLSYSLHCSLSFCWITLLSSEICEISLLHLLPLAACHAINHSVCDGLFNDVCHFEPSQIYVYGKGDDFISAKSKMVITNSKKASLWVISCHYIRKSKLQDV